ncbi:CDP-2,3-bis-(O-geranylgeranyl)-sn-glycerol synthase [Candidatus Woesearchaeota archaeon]|nr:CDP-2,3-bis-(O-geranylgeranyl)-sn-glycerol synthase [Candidatus Woesearchaeota archaeon]
MVESLAFFTLKCFYLMLPAYFANMAPVIANGINFLAYPVDFNRKIGGKPILGQNKTFRGIFFGILSAVVIAYIQHLLYSKEAFQSMSFIDYQNWLLFGFLTGFGALAGDLIKSIVKRRLNINPGDRFIPFDQTDFVFGALIFMMPIFDLTLKIFAAALLLSFILHIAVNHIAFYLRIRNEKW